MECNTTYSFFRIDTQKVLKKPIFDNWPNIFLWLVIHKVVVVNKWHGCIFGKELSPLWLAINWIGGAHVVELLIGPTKCGNLWLKLFGNSLPRRITLAIGNYSQWCNASLINPWTNPWSCSIVAYFSWGLSRIIWCQKNNLVFNATFWPVEKTHQVIRDSLLNYGRLQWQWTFVGLENNRRHDLSSCA